MRVQVYLPGFLSSNLYYKYLSDLINSVRADEFVHMGAPGQAGPVDNGRSSANSSEGPQTQVMPPPLTHVVRPCGGVPHSAWHLDLPSILIMPKGCDHSDEFFDFNNVPADAFSLQQGTRKAAVKILKNFDETITVDIASLDPEQLYQRPYAG